MKRKLAVFAVIILTLFNLTALTTVAYQRWTVGKRIQELPEGDIGMRGFRELGFDREQMARMEESRKEFMERTEPLEAELHQLRLRMFELIRTEEPDTSAVFALVDSVGLVQNELQKVAIAHMLEEGAILTPEQREHLFGMFEKHMDKKWKHRRGHGRGIHGGGARPFLPPREIGTKGRMGLRDRGDGFPEGIIDIRANEVTQGGN